MNSKKKRKRLLDCEKDIREIKKVKISKLSRAGTNLEARKTKRQISNSLPGKK